MRPETAFKIMTVKAQNPDSIPGGYSEALLDEAAWLCAGMPQHWYISGMMKFAAYRDHKDAYWLEIELWTEAAELAAREKWRVDGGQEQLRKLSVLAIRETIEPSIYKPVSKKLECTGFSPHRWFQTWGKRYEGVFQIIDDRWANSAYEYVAKRNRKNLQTKAC